VEAPDKAPGAFVEASCAPCRIMVAVESSPTPPPYLPHAACRRPGVNREWFFPPPGRDSATLHRALDVCAGCPHSEACLAYALTDRTLSGVWGGTSANQRRLLRRTMRAAS
jgi:WhiB family transcriptional regulator, redox-sensing transcriptional regulator